MIALISSTISPTNVKSTFSVNQRLQQTIYTIDRLLDKGVFSSIYLVDNSENYDFSDLRNKYKDLLQIINVKQYQFKNKGITEILLLLASLNSLPNNESIFKISGRYYPNENFNIEMNKETDFKILAYNYPSRKATMSTRAYFVANKILFQDFLLKSLSECIIYTHRVVGIRSALKMVGEMLVQTINSEINTSIEFSAMRVLKKSQYRIQVEEKIGIEGFVAGFRNDDFISE